MAGDFDYSKLSDAELEQLAGAGSPPAPAGVDYGQMSDEQLAQIAAPAAPPPAAVGRPRSPQAGFARMLDLPPMLNESSDPADQTRARANVRTVAEIGAGAATAPLTGGLPLLARLGVAGATGFGASLGSELFDPSEAPLRTAAGTAARFAAGEGIGSGIAAAARTVVPPLRRFAQTQGAKALGFIGSELRKSGPESARRVAQVALDEGVLGPLANSETMLGRAQGVQDSAGAALGQIRQQIDNLSPGQSVVPILQDVERALRDWRPGISTAPTLQRHLTDTLQDIAAYADPSTGKITAEGLAAVKKLLADRAYANALQVPETLAGALAPRTETARGFVQGAEETAAAGAGLSVPFQRGKDVYGAMARLTDPRSGALTARVARDLGNNQVFGMGQSLGAIGAAAATSNPVVGGAALLGSRLLYQRGNQISSTAADRIARLAAARNSPAGIRAAAQLILQRLATETDRGSSAELERDPRRPLP